MPDRVDTQVHGEQPSTLNAPVDRTTADSQALQLPPPDHSVLSSRQLADHPVDTTNSSPHCDSAPQTRSASVIPTTVDALLVAHAVDPAARTRAYGAHNVTSLKPGKQKRLQPAVAASGFDPFK